MANHERPDPELTNVVAGLLLQLGEPSGAREELKEGASHHGWLPSNMFLLTIADARDGQLDDALQKARELIDDPVLGADAQVLLIDLLLERGDLQAARLAAEAALRERPDATNLLLARARVAGREGMRAHQLSLIEKAVSLNSNDTAARTARGVALLEMGSRSEGQRDLAAVVAGDPSNNQARDALVGSAIRTRRGRLTLVAAFFLLPGISVFVPWLLTTIRGSRPPHWLSSAYVGALATVVLVAHLIDRLRTDRSVAVIKRDAHRGRLRGVPLLPTLRPLRWLLVATMAGLWIIFVAAGTVFDQALSPGRLIAGILLEVPAAIALVFALRLWKLRRDQLSRSEPRFFNPSSCHCHKVAKVGGRRAEAYIQRHLLHELTVHRGGIERYRCELLGVRWVWFSTNSGLRSEPLPIAFRLRDDVVPPMPVLESGKTNGYL
jgi:tetratricopeptide (TPR) repeat protein